MFLHYRMITSELPEGDKPLVKGASKELINFELQSNIVSHGICCNVSDINLDKRSMCKPTLTHQEESSNMGRLGEWLREYCTGYSYDGYQ